MAVTPVGQLSRDALYREEMHLDGRAATPGQKRRLAALQKEITRREQREQKQRATPKAAKAAKPKPASHSHKGTLDREYLRRARTLAHTQVGTTAGQAQADLPLFADNAYTPERGAREAAQRYPGVIGARSEVLRHWERFDRVRSDLHAQRLIRDSAHYSKPMRAAASRSIAALEPKETDARRALREAVARYDTKYAGALKLERAKARRRAKANPPAPKKAPKRQKRAATELEQRHHEAFEALLEAQRTYRDHPSEAQAKKVRAARASYQRAEEALEERNRAAGFIQNTRAPKYV